MELNNEVSFNILYIIFIFVTISIIFLYMKGGNIKIIVDRKKKKSRCKKKIGSRNHKKRSSMCKKKKSSRNHKKRSSRRYKKKSSRRYKKRSSCKKKNCKRHKKTSPKHLKSVDQIFPTEINSNLLINQHVVPYTIKDINQEFNVGKDLFVIVNNFHVPLRFLDVNYDKDNYDNTRIYHFGDVVTIKDPKSGELQDYVNLVSDLIGIVGQNPLKDKIAWLKIRINRLNGTSNSQLL